MTRFFQRLRKAVIGQGHIGNYLLYAAGEIVLVVIGILIALQINDWNEERKARQMERVYYCKLLEDVEQDQILLASLSTENEERIERCNEMISLLQERSSRKAIVSAMRGAVAKTTFTFKPGKSAFEDIKSSGSLHVLSDLVLKDQLINYYSVLDGYVDLVDVNSDAAVAMHYRVDKNFIEIGWQELDFVRSALDSSLVNVKALDSHEGYSTEMTKQLLSEAIFYVYTNARKRDLYKVMAVQIEEMKTALTRKCLN
jgi:hypothetical protein